GQAAMKTVVASPHNHKISRENDNDDESDYGNNPDPLRPRVLWKPKPEQVASRRSAVTHLRPIPLRRIAGDCVAQGCGKDEVGKCVNSIMSSDEIAAILRQVVDLLQRCNRVNEAKWLREHLDSALTTPGFDWPTFRGNLHRVTIGMGSLSDIH